MSMALFVNTRINELLRLKPNSMFTVPFKTLIWVSLAQTNYLKAHALGFKIHGNFCL